MSNQLILGINQYTHSAAVCFLNSGGDMLFCGEKERLTRKKHDGGDVADLVEHGLTTIGAKKEDITMVCANNHLFRIDRFHETVEWATALYQYRKSYLSQYNILPDTPRVELSHHLAHAWSIIGHAPFESGLIVVMDGMGSTLHEMQLPGDNYVSDFNIDKHRLFQESEKKESAFGWREGESAYLFEGFDLKRLHKRFVAEPTPPFLYNYGFENMESLGALYSRVSSHIFGDWNACGKVMGMAPWASNWNKKYKHTPVLKGSLDNLQVDWDRLKKESSPNQWNNVENRAQYATLSADIQKDLENVVINHLNKLQTLTNAQNLAFVGGVALNSTLNGRIHRECNFKNVFIPHYPGDQGVAIGCANFALAQKEKESHQIRCRPLSPFSGKQYSEQDVQKALKTWGGWLEKVTLNDKKLTETVVDAIEDGKVVAWFQGRSEFGPRALGNRSILADPRNKEMIKKINTAIKKRESYRPFAPTILNEHVPTFFTDDAESPYMSLTVKARDNIAKKIPAVIHCDGSARIQTLKEQDNPKFYTLIKKFYEKTGIPMLLNTSFNIKQEPIVESPSDAMNSFLNSSIDFLVIHNHLFKKKSFPDMLTSSMVPISIEEFTAETVSNSEGENISTRVMAYGKTIDLEQLELGLLEACKGNNDLGEIANYFQDTWEVEEEDLFLALETLFEKQLVTFISHTGD